MKGRIHDDDIAEIRRRAALAEVAAEYMQVKRAGRQFKALCPFHNEKSPSFSIEPAKNVYHCFGCGKGGDVFTLLMELEGLTFAESVEKLAQRTGVQVRYERLSAGERGAITKRARLMEGPAGAAAREYLKGRGFTRETVEAFDVGFAPAAWDELIKHLRASRFTDEELVEAGLASRTERGTIVDRFRKRIMFPVRELTGTPVAFGARRLDEQDAPKYLNSAESPIYKKGSVLYALDRAKAEVSRTGRVLVVEGYTDVMALHQAGIAEAVATCGTALGLEHLRLLRRFTERVVMSLDSDEAGRAAAEKAFDLGQEAQVDARMLVLPDGLDPAEYLQRNEPEQMRELIGAAVPIVEHRLRRAIAGFQMNEPEQQSRALRAAIPILARVGDDVMRQEYASRLSGWVHVDPSVTFAHVETARATGKVAVGADPKRLAPHVRCEREAIKLALQYPAESETHLSHVSVEDFALSTHRTIWLAIEGGTRDPGQIAEDERVVEAARVLSLEPPQGIEAGASEVPPRLVEEIFGRLKEIALTRQIDEMKERLQKLNPETHADQYESLWRELVSLEGERRRMTMVLQGGAE